MLRKGYRLVRKWIFTFIVVLEAGECGKHLTVNHFSKVNKNTYLKDHVNFNGMSIVGGGKTMIGSYFHSGEGCHIITSNHNYEGECIPYDSREIRKDVTIDDFVWLGSFVTVLPGVHIEEGAIIQAGAVVVNDIPAYAIAGGNPAKVFKHRDQEHFEKLKREGRFH